MSVSYRHPISKGQLHHIDELGADEHDKVGPAIRTYADTINSNKQSLHWQRCFPAGTGVLTPDGHSEPIESLKAGDEIQGSNGTTKIRSVFKYDSESLTELKIEGNLDVLSTSAHKHLSIRQEALEDPNGYFRTTRKMINGVRLCAGHPDRPISASLVEEIPAGEIKAGDWVIFGYTRAREKEPKLRLSDYIEDHRSELVGRRRSGRKRHTLPEIVDLDESFLRLLGLYLGDGSANYSNGSVNWVFGANEMHLAEEVRDTVERVFGLSASIKDRGNCIYVLTFSRSLVQFFKAIAGGGVGCPKVIHPDVFHSDACLLPVVDGFIDADGMTDTNGSRCIGVNSELNLMCQLRGILLDEGIYCSFTAVNSSEVKAKGWKTPYRFRIPSWYLNRVRSDTTVKSSHKPKTLCLDDGRFACRVKSCDEIAYDGYVYDLEVEAEDHLYLLASNMVTHNSVRNIENIFFTAGRHYVDDILVSRLANNSDSTVGDLSVIQESTRNIPKPTNDLLGKYIETNIALLTENKPRPRVTPKSDRDEDETAAELSELTLEHLWEALHMPAKMRETARMVLHTGISLLEVAWDPTVPRRMQLPKTEEEIRVSLPEGSDPEMIVAPRQVPVIDEKTGLPEMEDKVEYGDITCNIVTAFQFHTPAAHFWQDLGWTLKEEFVSIDQLHDKYLAPPPKETGLTKEKGWHLDSLDDLAEENVTSLSLWWWERISELVEGPGPSLYIGSPDYWEGHVIVRTFDRAPSSKWPRGRTILTVGDRVLYDSPKKIGARAYDPRWPNRWHPYIRYRWEGQTGSIYGRSLVSKLLPKIKRVNAIDTTLIMWRRTVPIATWISPKGANPVEDLWSGVPGRIWEYDARRTAGAKPEPVYPPPYPVAALQERETQILEMESIAGTEQVLHGERPVGVTSASMLDVLRKQALASRSSTLQEWDESHQELGELLLQTTIRYVKEDPRYLERIRILAREKHSRVAIEAFSGEDLSDNVIVRVDTASLALVSKEAREAKVLELLQYLPNLMAVEDIGLRTAILDELGMKKALMPSGPDVSRAKKMVSLVKQNKFERIAMLPEDDPYIFKALLVNESKNDGFIDMPQDQQQMIIMLIEVYDRQIKLREMEQQQQMLAQMEMAAALKGQGQE